MKVAVIGAGIFGITAALHLDEVGIDVSLFEQKNDILMGASYCNQFRLHKGYHYPRCPETVDTLLKSVSLFEDFYNECVISHNSHYYCISKEKTLTSSQQYLEFCKTKELKYKIKQLKHVSDKVDLSLLVDEKLISYDIIKKTCFEKLRKSNIKLYLKKPFSDFSKFDFIVNCTYKSINEYSYNKRNYQFELCEKIVAKLPDEFANISIVVMDGPFMCIDPYGDTGYHLLGNVVHAIHHTNVGEFPTIPSKYFNVLDNGRKKVDFTKFNDFIKSGKEYIPKLENAKYVDSMFTVRTVLPNLEKTDARPTLVSFNGNIINVFSGKIDTCVMAAKEIREIIVGNK